MNQIKDGWFKERNDLWQGQALTLQVKEVLFNGRSDYQDILVIETTNHGRALILDGIIQCTESDEFSYQEMISFLPLNVHPSPNKVLIVGGGDGGVAREVDKHPLVKQIVQVEIDAMVVEVSKKYLPGLSQGFNSKKLTLEVCNGFEYIKEHKNEFDVIITDSSDPIGPAANLFTEKYFQLLKGALKDNGIISTQCGTIWAGLDHVKQTMQHCSTFFKQAKYAVTNVPTYPTGQIGFIVATSDDNVDLTAPKHQLNLSTKYYTTDIHKASFVLPQFAAQLLNK